MKINSVSATNFGSGVRILGSENKTHKFLYNEVNNITKEFNVAATFHSDKIELPFVTQQVIKKLKELRINFIDI